MEIQFNNSTITAHIKLQTSTETVSECTGHPRDRASSIQRRLHSWLGEAHVNIKINIRVKNNSYSYMHNYL
jgi:hypothetical protein